MTDQRKHNDWTSVWQRLGNAVSRVASPLNALKKAFLGRGAISIKEPVKLSRNKHQFKWTHTIAKWWNTACQKIKQVFKHHITFYHMVALSKKWVSMVAAITALAVQTMVLPILLYKYQAHWVMALTGKSAALLGAGLSFIQIIMLVAAVSFLVERIHCYFITEVTHAVRSNLLDYVGNKTNLRHMQEEEGRLKSQQREGDFKGASVARTLANDVERFMMLFIGFHKYFGLVSYWVTRSLIGIYHIGLLQQGLSLLAVAGLASWLLGKMLSMGSASEQKMSAKDNFQQVWHSLVDERRSDAFPNFKKRSIDLLRRYAGDIRLLTLAEDLLEQIADAMSAFLYKAAEPTLVLSLFLIPYLETSMTYDLLQNNLSNLMNLFFAASSSIMFTYELGQLETTGKNIKRLFDEFFFNTSMTKDADKNTPSSRRGKVFQETYNNLKATQGEMTWDNQGHNNVIRFMAELSIASKASSPTMTTMSLFKRYHAPDDQALIRQKKPLEFYPNEMIYVVGENGAGKSVLCNTLSGLMPGLSVSDNLNLASTSALYCEQKLINLPPPTGSKPLSPMQILFLLWPELQGVEVDHLNDDLRLSYHNQQGQQLEIKVNEVKSIIDKYLVKLNFSRMQRVDASEEVSNKRLRTVDDLDQHAVDFNSMSGGQQGKLRLAMYFAMAEILKPRMFLIDEPYNHIDSSGKKAVKETIREMKNEKIFRHTTVMIVTHDDNNDIDLPYYDKVLAILAKEDSVGYYGKIGENSYSGYRAWLKNRAQDQSNVYEPIKAHCVYNVAV